jgi:hypothetical protein
MHELLAVVLICAAAVPGSDCSRGNALDVVSSPVHSHVECMLAGQVMATGLHVGEGEERRYVKVACERRSTASLAEVAE